MMRFTEKQIIGVLMEAEARAKVAELYRKHGISDAMYYNGKAAYNAFPCPRPSGSKLCYAGISDTIGPSAPIAWKR